MMGAVTVVITCHDYAEYVGLCLESVLSQRGVDVLEVLVIDDASQDASWSVISGYASDPRVRLVRHERNIGAVATYNVGYRLASGDYVVNLNADDFAVTPDALATQAAFLDAHPDAGFVFARTRVVNAEGREVGRISADLDPVTPGRKVFERLLYRNFIPHSGTMVRADTVRAAGLFDEDLWYSHDWDQWLRLASRSSVGYVARTLYAYRIHRRQHHVHGLSRSLIEWTAVLDRAEALGAGITKEMRRRSLARAHVYRAHTALAQGDSRNGLADLRLAAGLDARSLLLPEALKAIGRLLLARGRPRRGSSPHR